MILKFDDVIYKKTFEVDAKDEIFTTIVEITDKESERLGEVLNAMLHGEETGTEFSEIMFKDDLPKLKELLIGHNFVKFEMVVLEDFKNFITASIDSAIKTHSAQA